MGLFKILKKVYTEEYEEYEEDLEEIEDIAYDLNVMLPEPDTLSEQDEEARYDAMLDRVLDRERTAAAERTKQSEEASPALSYQSQAVKLPDVTRRPKKLDDVHIEIYDKEETRNYVKDQCEVMAEASEHIELAMAEYSVVTEHFADIELLENAPEKLRSAVFDAAERVDNLTVDRRIFKSAENKLSANAYHRMETLEEELPKGLAYVQQQETYYETVKRDMQILEGERMALRLEAHGLDRRQRQIKSGATAAAICLAVVFSIFVIAMIAMEDEENLMLFLIVTVLGAALALGMFAMLRMTQREVLVTEVKLNKAISLLNKTKIKYINAANTLDYEYQKYHVKSSYELSRKYQYYLEMKEEQKNILRMTENLNEAEEELLHLLRQLGMADASLWLGQVRALYDPKDMVEVRHELMTQRQKLRAQIEYNEKRIEEAKQNIKRVTVLHSDFLDEALKIIEQYEHSRSQV